MSLALPYLLPLLALPLLGLLLAGLAVLRRLLFGPPRPGTAFAEWEWPEPYR